VKVTIFGQGYVGLTLAMGAANSGIDVVGFDVNKELITNLSKSITDIPGIDVSKLKALIAARIYTPTFDFEQAQGSDILVIAVPTPLENNRKPDLRALKSVSELIATNFKSDALVVNESTSYPGTLRNFIKPIIDRSKFAKFQYASAPERVDPGNEVWNLENTPRVISGLTEEATSVAVNFYSKFCDDIYRAPTVEVAEASKIFENTFRQINIALVNEFSVIASNLGFSAIEAIQAAATKPFGFMPFYPGIGVGGHCIPVDPSYLSYASEKVGVEAKFINLANVTNLNMAQHIAIKIQDSLGGSLKNKKIQILGIAYKPGVSDMREAPSIRLIQELRLLGAEVSWHDPLVKSYNNENSKDLSIDIDLGLIISPHANIDFSVWSSSNVKILDLSSSPKNYGWPKFF
jgi:UDP-N-acetyl-D-glucosamine dehydrogenase